MISAERKIRPKKLDKQALLPKRNSPRETAQKGVATAPKTVHLVEQPLSEMR